MAKPDHLSQPQLSSLPTQILGTIAGNVVYAACQWGQVAVMARFGGPQKLGLFALSLAIANPVVMLSHLNLRSLVATDTKETHHIDDYIRLRMLVSSSAGIVIFLIALLAGYRGSALATIGFIGVAQLLEYVSETFYGLLQRHQQMNVIAISQALRSTLTVTAIGLAIVLTDSVLWAAVAMVIVRGAVTIYYDRRAARSLMISGSNSEWNWLRAMSIAWLALPLGVIALLNSLAINVPRYALEQYGGPRSLGLFVAVASLATVGSTLAMALGQVATPRLAAAFHAGDLGVFKRLVSAMAIGGVCLAGAGVVGASLFGKQVLSLAYRPEYATDSTLLTYMMIAGGFGLLASLLGYATTAARFFHAQLPVCATMCAVTAVASYLLVPSQGIAGAVIAVGIGNLVHCAGQLAVLVQGWRRVEEMRVTRNISNPISAEVSVT